MLLVGVGCFVAWWVFQMTVVLPLTVIGLMLVIYPAQVVTGVEEMMLMGTGVIVDGHIFRPNARPGTIECLEAQTGKSVWKQRARDHWASLVLAGENLYALNRSGTTVVLKPNPREYEEVASNELDESSNATPAFSNGQIFIRTDEHLYCIGE